MAIIDGNGIVLNCKMATQMMRFTRVLAAGAVLELLQFRALLFAHHAYELSQKILLVTHFQFKHNLGTMLVKETKYVLKKK